MSHATATRHTPRHLILIRIAVLALALLAGGSLLAAGTADAKKKRAKKVKIVSISPFATEVLARLNVKPVAIGDMPIKGYKNRLPKKFRGVRQLRLSHPFGPNLEQLAKIRKNRRMIVFSSKRWQKGTPGMRRIGVKQVPYVDPLNLKQVYRGVMKIGKKVNRRKQAKRLRNNIRKQVRNATRNIRKKPRVMGILGVGQSPQTFLGNSWGGQMMKLAGGRLMVGGGQAAVGAEAGFAKLSEEVVVVQNPQAILAVPHGTNTDMEAAVSYILDNPSWKTVDAIKNRKVFLHTDNRLLQATVDVGRTIRLIRKDLNRVGS